MRRLKRTLQINIVDRAVRSRAVIDSKKAPAEPGPPGAIWIDMIEPTLRTRELLVDAGGCIGSWLLVGTNFLVARLRWQTRRLALGDQLARMLLASQMQPLESVLLLDKVGRRWRHAALSTLPVIGMPCAWSRIGS